ncbi:MAG: hypothetical protein JW891_10295 [Candidatus Lokiarchaeota archaeon]|nr:hypothetical protein [Candidatus Lokiarchaeota archaeon]
MVYSPGTIYSDFSNNNITPASAVNLLVSLVEQGENDAIRLESLQFLKKIGNRGNISFKFLENTYVSENNHKLRECVLKIMKECFVQKSLPLIKWALEHENNIPCLILIVDIMQLIGEEIAKKLLVQEIKKILKIKLFKGKSTTSRNLFKNQLKSMMRSQRIENFTTGELADIFLNYKALDSLKKRFFSVHYELKNARLLELDLSDIEFEVRGWKAEFRNNIQDLSEISEILAFRSLEYLDLSNNHISNLDLINLIPSLKNINLSNNSISDSNEIEHLKSLTNLKCLDLQGNQVAQDIDPEKYPFLVKTTNNRIFF